MRLTAGSEATVARGLRWQARRLARAECEARYRGLEGRPVLPDEPVVALQPPLARFQDAEALVLVDGAGHDGRLFTDDALADHFRIHAFADRVMNEPPPGEKLCRHCTDVLDAHEIGEDVMALRRLRMVAEIDGSHGNSNSICLAVVEAARGH